MEQEHLKYVDKLSVKLLKEMSLADFTKYAEDVIQPQYRNRPEGFVLKFPYALNCSPYEKVEDCSNHARYTAFLNNAGTICHIMTPDDPDFLQRIYFRPSIKHLSKKKQKIAIWSRAHFHTNLGERPK